MSFYGNSRNLDYNLIVEKDKENDDGYLSYSFYQGLEANEETFIGKIDIPLDKILKDVKLEENESGTYLVFTFINEEGTAQPIYLDVKKLNEFNKVSSSSTIAMEIDNGNLTANINPGSISSNHLTSQAVKTDNLYAGAVTIDKLKSTLRGQIKALINLEGASPISIVKNEDFDNEDDNKVTISIVDKGITKQHLADDVMTTINNSVVFNYENGRLKISYANKQEENK